MSRVVDLHRQATAIPVMGDRLFSFAFSQVAPYFWSIRPWFTVIEPNHAKVVVPKRRGVQNHLGTVHAIALCNGLEAATGVLAEASIPPHRRWIPKGMEVAYTAKATSDVTCIAETDPEQWTGDDPRRAGAGEGRARRRHGRDRGRDPAVGDRPEVAQPTGRASSTPSTAAASVRPRRAIRRSSRAASADTTLFIAM
jgi:acyl-coenzyme A thioesterase PaaI-like protein